MTDVGLDVGGVVQRSRRILATLLWGLVALVAGCDECSPGQTRCDGDVYGWCNDDGDGPFATARWVEAKCPVACRVIGKTATCVSAAEPVTECAGATRVVCFEGVPTQCWGGYPVKQSPCGAPTHCAISPSCGAVCALDDTPEPRCSPIPFCDGGSVAHCSCDLVDRRVDCGAADLCREMGGQTVCIESTTPDPRCGDPTVRTVGFCEAGVAVTCWYGFVTYRADCGTSSCVVTAGQAACTGPVSAP